MAKKTTGSLAERIAAREKAKEEGGVAVEEQPSNEEDYIDAEAGEEEAPQRPRLPQVEDKEAEDAEADNNGSEPEKKRVTVKTIRDTLKARIEELEAESGFEDALAELKAEYEQRIADLKSEHEQSNTLLTELRSLYNQVS